MASQAISGLNGYEMLKNAGVVMPEHCREVRITIDTDHAVYMDFYCFADGECFEDMAQKIADAKDRYIMPNASDDVPDKTIKPLKPDIVTHGGKPSLAEEAVYHDAQCY